VRIETADSGLARRDATLVKQPASVLIDEGAVLIPADDCAGQALATTPPHHAATPSAARTNPDRPGLASVAGPPR
jgi:hypothetical protein